MGLTRKTITPAERPEASSIVMQNGVEQVGSTGQSRGEQLSKAAPWTPEDPHVPVDSSASPGSTKSSGKGDNLVFTERQLSRLATFLDDSLIKAPTPHKVG